MTIFTKTNLPRTEQNLLCRGRCLASSPPPISSPALCSRLPWERHTPTRLYCILCLLESLRCVQGNRRAFHLPPLSPSNTAYPPSITGRGHRGKLKSSASPETLCGIPHTPKPVLLLRGSGQREWELPSPRPQSWIGSLAVPLMSWRPWDVLGMTHSFKSLP